MILPNRVHPPNLYVELAKAHPFMNNVELAEKIGVSEATVRRNLRSAGFDRREDMRYVPEFLTPELDEPIEIIGPMGVTADWHLPLTDYAYINKMIHHYISLGITTLGIAGDFFNMDALSVYEPKQATAHLEREVEEGQILMAHLLDYFEKIVFTEGNHDFRLARALGHKLQFKRAISLLFGELPYAQRSRLEISNLDYFWNRPYAGAPDLVSWYICHPENYSSLPLSVARELAGKTGSHIMTGHSHHAAMGYAKSGIHTVMELGGLHDRRFTKYLQKTSKFAAWNKGYAWIDAENKGHLQTPDWGVG